VGPQQVTIRPPRAARIYVGVFTTVWCGLVFAGFVGAVLAGTPAAVIPLGMFAFGCTLGYRLLNVSVVATEDELIVHNYFSTKHVPKLQGQSFRFGSPAMGSFGKAVMVLLRDDTVVSMDATARLFRWFGGQRSLEAEIAELREWLAGSASER
jgi:hypothetical protein